MPEQILVLQYSDKAPAGVIGEELIRLGADLNTKNLLCGDIVSKQELSQSQGLLVLGGPISAFDPAFEIPLRLTTEVVSYFHQQSRPVFGICLGAQLLARAFEQPYRANNGWETGFTQLHLTEKGKQDALLSGLEPLPKLFEFHQDSFYLPDGAELLIQGDECTNQGFRLGSCSYGFQFHPEVTATVTQGWASLLAAKDTGIEQEAIDKLLNSDTADFAAQKHFAQRLAQRWLTLVRRSQSLHQKNPVVAAASQG